MATITVTINGKTAHGEARNLSQVADSVFDGLFDSTTVTFSDGYTVTAPFRVAMVEAQEHRDFGWVHDPAVLAADIAWELERYA